MRGIRTSLLAKIRPLKSLISGTRDDPAEDVSKVAGYWTDYNVTLHQDFRSIEESLTYLRWRNDQYFGYAALMPVNNQDGRVVLDFGCGPGHDVVGFSTEVPSGAIDRDRCVGFVTRRGASAVGVAPGEL